MTVSYDQSCLAVIIQCDGMWQERVFVSVPSCEKLLRCPSTLWWRGCCSLSLMDNSLFNVLPQPQSQKIPAWDPIQSLNPNPETQYRALTLTLRPSTEPAFLMILSSLLVSLALMLLPQHTTAKTLTLTLTL